MASVGTPSNQNCVVRFFTSSNGETEICNLRYLKILKGQVQWWIGSNADTSICGCGFSHLAQQETVVASAVSAFEGFVSETDELVPLKVALSIPFLVYVS